MSDEQEFSSGTVKWFDRNKGFGFIAMPNGALDVFIHANQLRKSGLDHALEEGDRVKFLVSKGEKGPFATNISKVVGDAITEVTAK